MKRKLHLLLPCFLLLCGFLFTHIASAQQVSIRGRIVDSLGNPLPNASVRVNHSHAGTISNGNGAFSLTTTGSSIVLTVSLIGYAPKEVTADGSAELTVHLQRAASSLNDVVVVGYGTSRKLAITGAVSSISAAEINQMPISNVAQGIEGRVSGVQVTQNSDAPGGSVSFRIRGTNSINGDSEPLYVIDGLQVSNTGSSKTGGNVTALNPLASLSPNDIESVEILKDASAAAIYGARGANGVVLITTKHGKAGATRVSYETYYGTQQISKKLKMMNGAQFADLENDVFNNPNYLPDPASYGQGTNWQDLVYRKAPIMNHLLTVSGGSDKTQMALSLNYFGQDGIAINSDFTRYSLRMNVDHKISNVFKVGASIYGSYVINNVIPTGQTTLDGPVITSSLIGAGVGAPPVLKPYDSLGAIWPSGNQLNGQFLESVNPLGLAAGINRSTDKRSLANVYGEANIAKGLTYRATLTADVQSGLYDNYSPISVVSSANLNSNSGSATKSNSNTLVLLHESILTYSTRFAERHTLKLTGVYSNQVSTSNSNQINATGFPNDATTDEDLAIALNRSVSSYRQKSNLVSYMGRINYGYMDKYFVDVTGRLDGSSTFGANHKYGFFPAASAGWRILQEPFARNWHFLSDLKLRASYGLTGNADAIGPYGSLALVGNAGTYQFNHAQQVGLAPTGIPNKDLQWESSLQSDIGLDLGLLHNRITLVADVYDKKTTKLLYQQNLPLSSGYSTITGNFASLDNRGLELAANARIIDKAFKWDFSGNISFNRNKVLNLDNGTTDSIFVTTYSLLQVGKPMGLFKTYVFNGIYQTGEKILPGSGSYTGGTKVKDLNGDGQITAADQTITGNPNPKFIYGFSNNFSYKHFDLSIFFQGTYGNDIYNVARYTLENPSGGQNVLEGLVNRWTPTNPNNQYAAPLQGGRLPISSRFVEDGSFLRCKNVTLGYTLPRIRHVYGARVYVSATNLFVITKYSGYDPEVNSYGNSNVAIGIDNLVYPSSRTLLAGLSITF
jgi:TonB-linked SusC/RagA family outer membrane protein